MAEKWNNFTDCVVFYLKKFKVGQRVIGNENNPYGITKRNTIWYIVEIKQEGKIVVSNKRYEGKTFPVHSLFFDLFMEEVE